MKNKITMLILGFATCLAIPSSLKAAAEHIASVDQAVAAQIPATQQLSQPADLAYIARTIYENRSDDLAVERILDENLRGRLAGMNSAEPLEQINALQDAVKKALLSMILQNDAGKKFNEMISRRKELIAKKSVTFTALPGDLHRVITEKLDAVDLGHLIKASKRYYELLQGEFSRRGELIRYWATKPINTTTLHEGRVSSVAISPDGKYLALSQNGELRLCDLSTSAPSDIAGQNVPSALVFSPDGKSLAFGDGRSISAGTLKDRKLEKVEILKKCFCTTIFSAVFVPDNKIRVTAYNQTASKFAVWEIVIATKLMSVIWEINNVKVEDAGFSPDGTIVAFIDARLNSIVLWDLKINKKIRQIDVSDTALYLALSPRGDIVALACSDNVIRLWNAINGKEIRQLPVADARAVAFSPDGKKLAAGSEDGTIKVWEANE